MYFLLTIIFFSSFDLLVRTNNSISCYHDTDNDITSAPQPKPSRERARAGVAHGERRELAALHVLTSISATLIRVSV